MRFDFKKIASVLASVVMLGSTAGMALAANYPAPLVSAGAADGAIVVTSGDHPGSNVDFWAAVDLQTSLQALVTQKAETTEGTISGEAYPLFTGASKIYFNDSINQVKSIITDTEMPNSLADSDFSGNVDADVTQTVTFTSWPYVTFDKMPTGDEDPAVGMLLTTTKGKDLYNLTITFDKAVNFTHADSEGETIVLFGQEFTIGTATDNTNLIMYKSSQTITLSVGGDSPNPSQTVTIDGKDYTVELTAATDTSATVRITDSDGGSDTKEVSEAASKKIQGVEVAVNLADESTATNAISAEVTVGAQKVKLTEGNEVKLGTDETTIDGTNINFAGGGSTHNLTKIVIQVTAGDSDSDAIVPGGEFIDPIFGSLKVDFVGLNIEASSTARELLEVKSTSDKATLKMTTHKGDEKTITWYNNDSAAAVLADSSRKYIRVREMAKVNESEYIVVGNEDEGYLVKVRDINNATTGYADDAVKFEDVFSDADNPRTWDATITAEGTGTVTIGGKQFDVWYVADKASKPSNAFYLTLNYPDSSTAGNMILFPTIQTAKGAKVAFYEPQVINLSNFDSRDGAMSSNVTGLIFPDGKGYETTITVASNGGSEYGIFNFTVGGVVYTFSGNNSMGRNAVNVSVGINDGTKTAFKYNISSGSGHDQINVTLMDNAGVHIQKPAIMVFEEEDDNNDRLGFIIEMEGGGDSNNEVGVADIEFPASFGASRTITNFKQLETDDDLYQWVDLYGVIATIDKSTTSQYTATISYPDEQIYAQVYASEAGASVTGATVGGAGGQVVVVEDTNVNSVSNKNLVIVGGSCINTAAARVLGVSAGTCGADFTAKTNVGVGQYLIKAIESPYNADKTAILVAGYDAADTQAAVAKLKTGVVTDENTEVVGP